MLDALGLVGVAHGSAVADATQSKAVAILVSKWIEKDDEIVVAYPIPEPTPIMP